MGRNSRRRKKRETRGACEGKKRYDYATAKAKAAHQTEASGVLITDYRCPSCGFYHIGRLSKKVQQQRETVAVWG